MTGQRAGHVGACGGMGLRHGVLERAAPWAGRSQGRRPSARTEEGGDPKFNFKGLTPAVS